jgi:hypothetical protein
VRSSALSLLLARVWVATHSIELLRDEVRGRPPPPRAAAAARGGAGGGGGGARGGDRADGGRQLY